MYDQPNRVLHNDLCDSACRLIEDEINMVLSEDAMRRIRCFRIIEYLTGNQETRFNEMKPLNVERKSVRIHVKSQRGRTSYCSSISITAWLCSFRANVTSLMIG